MQIHVRDQAHRKTIEITYNFLCDVGEPNVSNFVCPPVRNGSEVRL